MTTFNLIDRQFIPCTTAAGFREFNLRDAVVDAHEIVELRDESPLVTLTLHRLMLAVLHRVFGPKSIAAWETLWTAGRFPAGELDAYFAQFHGRFDLFDDTRPFFQTPKLEITPRDGVNRLSPPVSGTNTSFLFSHVSDRDPPAVPVATAARWLIAHQLTAGPGGRGYGASPLSRGIGLLVVGRTLFETLMLNFVRVKGNEPIPTTSDDTPAWERRAVDDELPQVPDGYLDYLTWLPRRIRLDAPDDSQPELVRTMSYAAGRMFRPAEGSPVYDPMLAYRVRADGGDTALQFDEDRALWRDSATLFATTAGERDRRPATLRELGALVAADVLPAGHRKLAALGWCADNAKVFFWRHETIPLPLDYLANADLVNTLTEGIKLAEKVGDAVRFATAELAKYLLAPATLKPDEKRKWQVVDAIAADRLYWSQLEPPFRTFMVALAAAGDDGGRAAELHKWFHQTLTRTARNSFAESAGQLDNSARVLRAVAIATQKLNVDLAKVRKAHNIPKPPKKEGASA